MNPLSIIQRANSDGVNLRLSTNGSIKATGDGTAVARWLPAIREHKAAIIEELTVMASTTSRWWLIHYPDREPMQVACCPDESHSGIMQAYPDAVAAEPFTPTPTKPSGPITPRDEAAIRAWLAAIGETDAATIADVIDGCHKDADARAYFIRMARLDSRLM